MKRITDVIVGILLVALGLSCNRSTSAGGTGSEVSFQDFLNLFPEVSRPFSWDRDSLELRFPDSLSLDRAKVGVYLADSLWGAGGGTQARTRIYPVGRIRYPDHLRVLVAETAFGSGRRGWLLVYGKADTLVSVMQVASLDQHAPSDVFSLNIDNQYLVHVNERKTLSTGQVILRERVYSIDADGSAVLILTNTNQPASAGSYVNPIDTLAATEAHSGDYFSGSSGIVSVRDGKTSRECRFYVHLDQQGGDCTGEVEGVARFTGKNTAEFTQQDGPCAIRFTFTRNQVVIRETGGCGAYRGVGCYFDGTYRKKPASAAAHKKH